MKKKILSLILAIAMVLPLVPAFELPVAAATSGKTGDCTWTLDGTTLTISGNGAMGDYSWTSHAPWGTSITKVIIENGVTTIGAHTFKDCDSLTSITIPKGITTIGSYAFYACDYLVSVTIPDSVTRIDAQSFRDCQRLTSVIIPASITTIDDGLFYGCTSLSSVTIPNSVTTIRDYAFYNCSSLATITIPNNVKNIGEEAFSGTSWYNKQTNGLIYAGKVAYKIKGTSAKSYTIKSGTIGIAGSAFKNSNITTITIPISVTSIGNYAFDGCNNLKTIYYTGSQANHNKITIGYYNTALTSATWSYNYCSKNTTNSIHVYDGGCDAECNKCGEFRTNAHTYDHEFDTICNKCGFSRTLTYDSYGTTGECYWYLIGTELAISGNGKMEDYYVTEGNLSYNIIAPWGKDVTKVTIEDGVTHIGSYAFNSYQNLTSVTVGDSVTTIGEHAFARCSNLTSVVIGNSVTTIGGRAFEYCSALTSVAIPDSVTTIDWYAFSDCSSLASVTIGDKVTTIGNGAFYNCSGLTSVSLSNSIVTIGSSAFKNCTSLESVIFPDSVATIDYYAFEGCTSLTTVTILNSSTSIGSYVFYGCSKLTNVYYIGSQDDRNKMSIGYNNSNLTSATWHYDYCEKNTDGWTHIYDDDCDTTCNICTKERTVIHTYDHTFDTICNKCGFSRTLTYDSYGTTGECCWCLIGTELFISGNGAMGDYDYYTNSKKAPWGTSITKVIIEEGVTNVGNYAFKNCSNLTSITIGSSVTSIGKYAFEMCFYLTTITIPDSVISIGHGAFSMCSHLTSITLGDRVAVIDGCAFDSCSALTSITIPNSVTSIGDSAFNNCSGLTSVKIPSSVTAIGRNPFSGCCNLESITVSIENPFYRSDGSCLIEAQSKTLISGCKNSIIPVDGIITTIGELSFYRCDSLTAITIPSSVTTIGSSAFSGCKNLTSVNIGDNVTYIGFGAFAECSKITSILLPNSVTSIGSTAFSYCSALTFIDIPNSVTQIASGTFQNCTSLASVILPDSVTTVDSDAFYYCSSLQNVYYTGTQTDRNKISIRYDNSNLTSATWHYNYCAKNTENYIHTYDNDCDSECNICGESRTVSDHVYDNACDVNCSICNFIRVPPHSYDNLSAFKCNLCGINRPVAPSILSVTDTTVTLVFTEGMDYSMDGGATWQKSNVFVGLLPNTSYTFYQRIAETALLNASDKSVAVHATTNKSSQLLIPSLPIAETVTKTSITLVSVEGCEYSLGGTSWQSSPTFTGLTEATAYTFYQRYKATATHYAGEKSESASISTQKGVQTAPKAPTAEKVTDNSVTLVSFVGVEYSLDGEIWQTEPTFYELSPNTTYTFYQRLVETDKLYASPSSLGLTITTHIYDNDCDTTCNECGEIRTTNDHVFPHTCDTACKECGVTRDPLAPHTYDNADDINCNVCGATKYTPGDVDGNSTLDTDDAIYLLYYVNFPSSYPINQPADFDGNGVVDTDDAIYLLYHVNFPSTYPLH